MRRRAVFLDRDGILNDLVYHAATGAYESPHTAAEVVMRPRVADTINELRSAGFAVFVVTNQPSAAKAKCTLADLAVVHDRITRLLAEAGAYVDATYVCHHHPDGTVPGLMGPCDCRKPSPASLLRVRDEHGVALEHSYMVGDRESDVECGRRAGCRTVLVQYRHTESSVERCRPDLVAADLPGAAKLILAEAGSTCRGSIASR